MRGYNTLSVLGKITSKSEIKEPPLVATQRIEFEIEVKRNHKDEEGMEQTDTIPAVAYNQLAQIANDYMQTGSIVLIEGRIQSMGDGLKIYCKGINILKGPKMIDMRPDENIIKE